jgi:hypothetical protein
MNTSIGDFWKDCEELCAAAILLLARLELRRLDAMLPELPQKLHRYRRQIKALIDLLSRLKNQDCLSHDEWWELRPFAQKANEAGAGLNISELFPANPIVTR